MADSAVLAALARTDANKRCFECDERVRLEALHAAGLGGLVAMCVSASAVSIFAPQSVHT